MFNVYLPKLLETRPGANTGVPQTLEDSLWDVMIFTIGGCPGALVRRSPSCKLDLRRLMIFLLAGSLLDRIKLRP